MRVLITGINGFIGHHLANKFMSMNHEVIGIDQAVLSSDFKTYKINLLLGDIISLLEEIKPDLIIHCAGLASVAYSMDYPEEDFKVNTWMVYRLLNSMRESGLAQTRFILLSSAAVYGQPDKLPISENAMLQPISPYALHKKMAEDICNYFINQYSFDIRILRIFSAYGPGLKKQIFWDMYQKIINTRRLELFGSGDESRDYIYIDDLTEAVYLIAIDKQKRYTVWNVANGIEVTIRKVAEAFVEAEHVPQDDVVFNGQVRQGDPMNWCADISRLQELGYKQKISMEDGITAYLKWVQDMEREEEV